MTEINISATSEDIDNEINAELERAAVLHPPRFASTMEALGVITEEYHEVIEAFRRSKDNDPEANTRLRVELTQLAAMCKKAIVSCCTVDNGEDNEGDIEWAILSLLVYTSDPVEVRLMIERIKPYFTFTKFYCRVVYKIICELNAENKRVGLPEVLSRLQDHDHKPLHFESIARIACKLCTHDSSLMSLFNKL